MQIQPGYVLCMENEQADAGRDGRTRLARPILRRERGQENNIFPVSSQLTKRRIWQPRNTFLYNIMRILKKNLNASRSSGIRQITKDRASGEMQERNAEYCLYCVLICTVYPSVRQ